jgi:hypothetical protein
MDDNNNSTYNTSSAALPFAGRFYRATDRVIMELDIASDDCRKPPLRIRMAIESSLIHSSRALQSTLHLVDNGGELILVQRMLWPDHYAHDDGSYRTKRSRKYEAWRVDFDAGILVPVKGFNWRALFISMSRAISVSAETLPFVAADTIYFGYCGNLERYSLADGSIERFEPCTIVDCLSYCIQGFGLIL